MPEKPYRDDDDNVLKRRLLGAAVLIALAVILLPLLLDGSGSESRFRRVEQLRQEPPRVIESGSKVTIPDKSEIPRPQVPAALPDTPAQQAAKPAPSEAATQSISPGAAQKNPESAKVPVPEAAVAEPAPMPASDQVVESVAWVIQAGSYADEANARTLQDRLRSEGYPAFTTEAVNGGKAVFRVKVGPINNRREAGAVQQQVEKLIGQSTLVRQYP